MTQFLIMTGDVLLYGGLPAIVVFTVLYGARSQWRRYPEGRALFAKSLGLTLVTLSIGLSIALGPNYLLRPYVRVAAFGFFFASSWWFAVQLIVSQHRSRIPARKLVRELREARRRERDTP